MMSIGLHLRMVGRPGRIGALTASFGMSPGAALLDAPRAAIAQHWLATFPNGASPRCAEDVDGLYHSRRR